MPKFEKISLNISYNNNMVFHDTKKDIESIVQILNIFKEKINEIIEELNKKDN